MRVAVLRAAALVVGAAVGILGPLAALAPIGLVGVAWATIRAPGVLLGAFLLIPYYKASLAGLFPVDLTVLLAVVNGFQLVVIVMRFRYRGSRAVLVLWLLLWIVVLAGVAWAGDQSVALGLAVVWAALVLVRSASAVRVASERRFVDQFLATLLLAGVVLVALGLPGLFGDERLRLFGENTIQTGQITLIVVIIAGRWFVREGPSGLRWRLAPIVPLAVHRVDRFGLAWPACSRLVRSLLRRLSRLPDPATSIRACPSIGLVGILAVAVLAAPIDRFPGEALGRFGASGPGLVLGAIDTSVGARADFFGLAGRMFLDQPLLGTGTADSPPTHRPTLDSIRHFYPHNDLLQCRGRAWDPGPHPVQRLVGVALVRGIPDEPRWWTLRGLALFMLVNALVSGDIYTDRLLWGLLVDPRCRPSQGPGTDATPDVEVISSRCATGTSQ